MVQPDRELQGPRHDGDGLAAGAPGRRRDILEDSSGNGGASVAAYAAAAGIKAKILAPDSTSEAKTLQSRMHGAALELVPGPRQATADEAVRQSSERFYASHNWHPFFLQGTKLIAYEIWEDLGFRGARRRAATARRRAASRSAARSASASCGARARSTARRGCSRCSPSNCSPLARAFAAGEHAAARAAWTAARSPRARRSPSPCATSRCWRGARERRDDRAVPEDEIAPAVRTLARHGLYAEPTSAIVIAALGRRRRRPLAPGETVVTVLTGSGLKAAATMAQILEGAP